MSRPVSCCVGWVQRGARWVVVAVLCALLLGLMQAAVAQKADLPVRQQALEAFHGPDLEGKDGPLAKAGFDLALLYYEWNATQRQDAAADGAPSSSLSVQSGSVTIDATAAQDPSALRDSLVALGLTNDALAGPVVSGRLPIAAIPEAAQLAALRAMRPARDRIHGAGPVDAHEPVPLRVGADKLSSGLYLIHVRGTTFSATRRVTVVR